MKITDISVTKKGRYALFVDGEFLFSAEEEALVRSGLRPGMETDIQTLEALRRESEYIYGREWALHLLEYKAYSRRMLLDRLRRQIDEDIAEQVADRLCELGLIDDRYYASPMPGICSGSRGIPGSGSPRLCARRGSSRIPSRKCWSSLTPGNRMPGSGS